MAATKKDDLGQAEVQSNYDEAAKKGHFGEKPGSIPNEAYSLETGPDSPSALDAHVAAAEQRAKDIASSGHGQKKEG